MDASNVLVGAAPKMLSSQAWLAVIGYSLVAVAVLLPIKGSKDPKNQPEYNLADRLLVILAMLIPMALSVYTINCLVMGSSGMWCDKWSWLNAALVFIWSVLIFGVSVYGAFIPVEEPTNVSPAAAL